MLYPALELLEGGGKLLDWLYDSTRNFVSSVSSTLELPDTDCKRSAPGSDSPLRRGGEAGQRALGVLSSFPEVSVRLCGRRCPRCLAGLAQH